MIEQKFEEVFTFENLFQGHMRGRMSKRDKKPLVRFEMSMLENVYNIYRDLNNGTFKFKGYSSFVVYEPKRRQIQTLHYGDRVVQHVLCDDVLMPYFSRRAITDNAVCQEGKGTHFALRRFEEKVRAFIRKHGVNGYILKCDVLKYFPTIPHEKLKEIFCTQIRDEKIKKLVTGVIDSYHTEIKFLDNYGISPIGCDPKNTGRGVPIGNQTSQIFGMYYLNSIDRLIKEKHRIKIYSRYMDDFVIVHEDKEYLRKLLAEIRVAVSALGLTLNDKTQIAPLKNGFTYLGFRYFVTPTGKLVKTVKKQSKRRIRWRARLLKKAYIEGLIESERIRQSLAAFHGHLKHAKNVKLEREVTKKLSAYANVDLTKDKV